MFKKDFTSGEIRDLQTRANMDQEEFAKACCVSIVTMSRWRNGHYKPTGGGSVALSFIHFLLGKNQLGQQRVDTFRLLKEIRACSDKHDTMLCLAMLIAEAETKSIILDEA